MSKDQELIPNFLSVFEHKLERLKKQIKTELAKPKRERHRAQLKDMLNNAKTLKHAVHKVRKQQTKLCPHCGREI